MKDNKSDSEEFSKTQNENIHKIKSFSKQEQVLGDYFVAEIEDTTKQDLIPITVPQTQLEIYKGKPYRKFSLNKEGSKHSFMCAKILKSKKPFFKRTLFKVAVILVLGVVSGSILGGWYKNYADGLTKVDYPESAEPYLDDTNAVISSALGKTNASDSEMKNFSAILKANGKTPMSFSASQNFIMAAYKASLATSFRTIGRGQVATIATQSVFSIRAFDGQTYELTSQSKGLMTVAICAVHKKDANSVDLIHGTNVQDETADWNGEKKTYTLNEFLNLNGSLPDIISPYVVSSKTILNENDIQIEYTTHNNKPVYVYTMNLDPVLGAIRYHKQVMLTSGLSSSPKFDDISIKVYLDEDWNFVRTEIVENYTIKYGIPAACKGTLDVDYEFNVPITLPY